MDAAVDDRFFHGLKSLFAAHNQFAQGQNEIGFQGNGIVLLGVIAVDVHGVDILGGGWADFDDLTLQPRHQCRIFGFGITDDDVVTGGEEGIGDLTLCGEGLAGTGGTQNQTVGVFVKRNFLGAGKSYMIKGKQAEKKAENAPCGRLKCVLVTGSIKPMPTSEKRLRQG